jgi:hypothetical protein
MMQFSVILIPAMKASHLFTLSLKEAPGRRRRECLRHVDTRRYDRAGAGIYSLDAHGFKGGARKVEAIMKNEPLAPELATRPGCSWLR